MLVIDITSNLDELAVELNDLQRQQLPFALSLTLNETVKDVRRVIVGSTWPRAFTVRNKAFPGRLFRIKFSKKGHLEAELYDSLGREFVDRHITGGVKTARGGGRVAVPVNVARTGTGRIPKGRKPGAITKKKSTRIVRGKSGNDLIIERFKGQTIVRYVLAPSARIKSTFRFDEDAIKTVNRVINGHFNASMMRAARSARLIQVR